MNEYQEPKFSCPGMKTDQMRVKELEQTVSDFRSVLNAIANGSYGALNMKTFAKEVLSQHPQNQGEK